MKKFDQWVIVIDNEEGMEDYLQYLSKLSLLLEPKKIDVLYTIESDEISEAILKEIPELQSTEFKEVEDLLKEMVDNHFACTGEVAFVVKRGKPLMEIIKHAKASQADFVSLMSRNDNSTRQLIHKVARKAPCNVMIIPEGQPLELRSIMVPLDFSEHADMAYEFSNFMAKKLDELDVHAYHAYHDSSKYVHQIFETTYEVDHYFKKKTALDVSLERHAKYRLSNYVSSHVLGGEVKIHTELIEKRQNVGEKIQHWIEAHRPDLVIMGSKGVSNSIISLTGAVAEHVYTHTKHMQPLMLMKKEGENSGLIRTLIGI